VLGAEVAHLRFVSSQVEHLWVAVVEPVLLGLCALLREEVDEVRFTCTVEGSEMVRVGLELSFFTFLGEGVEVAVDMAPANGAHLSASVIKSWRAYDDVFLICDVIRDASLSLHATVCFFHYLVGDTLQLVSIEVGCHLLSLGFGLRVDDWFALFHVVGGETLNLLLSLVNVD